MTAKTPIRRSNARSAIWIFALAIVAALIAAAFYSLAL